MLSCLSPSGDPSGATDTAALQAAIDAAPRGATLLINAPAATPFHLNAPLRYANGVTLLGVGGAARNGANMFRQAAGANLVAPGLPRLNGRGVWMPDAAYDVDDAVLVAVQSEQSAYPGARPRGDVTAATAYAVNDVVFDPTANRTFLCIAAHSSAPAAAPIPPSADPAHWIQVATQLYRCTTAVRGALAPPRDPSHWALVGDTGLFVPAEWAHNDAWDGAPTVFENIAIDANRGANPYSSACGLITQNFWSDVRHCFVENVPGRAGILQTDTTAEGTVIGSSSSENRISSCKIRNCTLHGFRTHNASTTTNQDGFVTDCAISDVCGSAIELDRAAGWLLRGNHLYGIGNAGISAHNAFSTTIVENQVEDFGGQGAPGFYYTGIAVTQADGHGTHLAHNTIGCYEPSFNAVGGFQYLAVTAGGGQSDAHVVLDGNLVHGPVTPSGRGIGWVLQANPGGMQTAQLSANRASGVDTVSYIADGVRIIATDSHQRAHALTGARTTIRAEAAGADSALTPDSCDLFGQASAGSPAAVSAGAILSVIFEQPFAAAPVVTISAANAATAGLGVPAVSATPSGFTIHVLTPPAASQPAGTYAWTYTVGG